MDASDQVDRNYAAFIDMLPDLIQKQPGRFALLHDERVVEFFENAAAAVTRGLRKYGVGNYSVQEVTMQADDLGFYSYAGGAMQA